MAQKDSRSQPPGWMERLLQQHAQVFFFTLGRLYRNPIGTVLTAAVIGITLALPAGLHLTLKNLSAVSYSWEGSLQASLFLKDSVGRERGEALARELQAQPGVAATRYISREQSLAEFRVLSGFGEALDILDENPLPAVVVVTPDAAQAPERIEQLVAGLAALPEVDLAQLDQKWLERLYAILSMVQRGVTFLAALLAMAVIVTVGNTIRLDIENRRDEIVVMKLVGAPDGFIRRPFLYTGFWYGFTGGVIALLLVGLALLAVGGPAARLSGLYDSGFRLSGLSGAGTLAVLGGGVLLGWLGAFWTVTRHLGRIEPA